MALPLSRQVRDTDGYRWLVTVESGRLVLTCRDGATDTLTVVFDDPADLRWLGPQITRATAQADIDAKADRATSRARAHQRAILNRLPTGDPYGRYEDRRPA